MVIESKPLLEIIVHQSLIYENEIKNGTIMFLNNELKKHVLSNNKLIMDAAVNELNKINNDD